VSRYTTTQHDAPSTSYRIVRDWRQDAACADLHPDLHHPVGDTLAAQAQADVARAVCHSCPVMDECREWALDNLADGVAGGLTEKERRTIRRRPRGRTAELSPCGTEAAVRRHQRNGETCRVCLDAQQRRRAAQYVRKPVAA